MFKFFDFIVTLISSVVNFVISSIQMIVMVIVQIVRGIGYLTTTVAYLPLALRAPILAIIAFSVIVTLINKGE